MRRTYMGMTGPHPAMPLLMKQFMGSREHAHQELKNPPVPQIGFQGCVPPAQ